MKLTAFATLWLAAAPAAALEIGDPMNTVQNLLPAPCNAALATRENVLELTGEATVNGNTGPILLLVDRHGNFLHRSDTELPTAECRHGQGGWRVDWTGMPGPLDLSNRERSELETWIATGLWPARPELITVESGPEPGDGAELQLRVRLTDGTQSGDLTVDSRTGRPLRLVMHGLYGEAIVQFEGTLEFDGMKFPERIVRTIEGLPDSETTFREIRDGGPASSNRPLGERPDRPDDIRFTDGSTDVALKFAPTGHVLVRPRVNGRELDRFIFDTGASQSGISPATVETLGLTVVGKTVGVSILGTSEAPVYRADRLELGPATLSDPVFACLDMSPLEQYFGEPVGGIIGYDILSRSIVEIDLSDGTLRIHDPAGFKLAEGDWIPMQLQDNHPILPAEFEGRRGLFRLDVGANIGLLMHGPTVNDLNLLDGRETTEIDLGMQKGKAGKIASLTLAGKTFTDIDAVFTEDRTGIFADTHTAGNIGMPLLNSFRMVLDYRNERIALIRKEG